MCKDQTREELDSGCTSLLRICGDIRNVLSAMVSHGLRPGFHWLPTEQAVLFERVVLSRVNHVEVDICMERAEGSWASFGVTRYVQVIKSALMAKVL